MTDEEKIGVVLIGDEIKSRPLEDVRRAAGIAGIPEEFIRDVKPRNAFLRGMRLMVKDGIVNADLPPDKALDDEDKIRVAFVVRRNQTDNLHYHPDVVIDFDKLTEMVTIIEKPATVSDTVILMHARELLEKAKTLCNTGDIGRLVKRFMDSQCRRIAIRPGVYFVPRQYEGAADVVQKFYKELNFEFMKLPVGYDHNNLKAVQAGIVKDLKQNIAECERKMRDLKKDGGTVSKFAARGRLKALKKSHAEYRELAASIGTTFEKICEEAGDAGRTLAFSAMAPGEVIVAIQAGKKFDPLSVELFESSEDYLGIIPAQAMTAGATPVKSGKKQKVTLPSTPELAGPIV